VAGAYAVLRQVSICQKAKRKGSKIMKTVVGLFDNFTEAQNVLQGLLDSGYSRDSISIVAADREGKFADEFYDTDVEAHAAESAATGAVSGGLLGGIAGFVIGLSALTIPGLGPIIAAGPIASALVGAGIGAVAGGVIGALVGWGIPEEHAEYYAEGVRRGGTLVAVKTEENLVDDVSNIMRRYGPVDLEERSAEWRESGWTGFEVADDEYVYYEPRYRRHYSANYAQGSHAFDYYAPAYRYGYDLAYNEAYDDYDWSDLEPEARSTWDEKFDGAWEEFKDAVRQGWQEVKDVFDTDEYHYYEPKYRTHYQQNYAQSGRNYDYYESAYRYGNTLGFSGDYDTAVWHDVEPRARREWEYEFDTAWDDIKNTVRYAWEETKDAVDVDDWYDEYEPNFRRHYYTYYAYGPYPYGRYIPAYRYGYELAHDTRYTDRDWDDITKDAAHDWDNKFEGAWDDFKDAVRHGWEKAKSAGREFADDVEDVFDPEPEYR
jgi:hypothetical protein